MRFKLFIALMWIVAPAGLSLGGVVQTQSGQQWIGRTTLDDGGQVVVTGDSGVIGKAPLAEVRYVELGDAAPHLEQLLAQNSGRPTDWQSTDIGNPRMAGSSKWSNDSIDITASGWGLWSDVDSCHFVHTSFNCDGQIVAHLAVPSSGSVDVSAGLMIRDSLDPSAPFTAVVINSAGEVDVKSRPFIAKPSQAPTNTPVKGGIWLRLTRSGDQLKAWRSTNGQFWEMISSCEMKIGTNAEIGLVACTQVNAASATVHFDHAVLVRGDPDDFPEAASLLPGRGIVLLDGSSVAGKTVSVDREAATLIDAAGKSQTVPVSNIAWIIYHAAGIDPQQLLTQKNPGILLQSGDFCDGDVTQCTEKTVDINTILFGPKSFDLSSEALAIQFKPPTTIGRYRIKTKDGKSIISNALAVRSGELKADDQSISIDNVTELTAAAAIQLRTP